MAIENWRKEWLNIIYGKKSNNSREEGRGRREEGFMIYDLRSFSNTCES